MHKKRLALVAHDNKKSDILDFVEKHIEILQRFNLCATGTTGKLIREKNGISIQLYFSGPLGGDFQIGTEIVNNKIDSLIFFLGSIRSSTT